jgi:large subunit ribosomal protein L18
MEQIKKTKRKFRHKRIRARVTGTAKIPRLCVFCSNKHIYAQLVDDEKGKTILSFDDRKLKRKAKGKVFGANEVGQLLARESLEKKIEKVVFDRGGRKYHGRVKSLAEGARQGGLKF